MAVITLDLLEDMDEEFQEIFHIKGEYIYAKKEEVKQIMNKYRTISLEETEDE